MRVAALPSSLLVVLGLAGCGPIVSVASGGGTDSEGSAEGPLTEPSMPPPTSPPGPSFPGTVGCLTQLDTSTTTGVEDDESEVGACLGFIMDPTVVTTTGTDTDTGTDTGTSTDTGTGTSTSDSTTSPGADNDRGRILQRLHESGVLPRDLLDRLERRGGGRLDSERDAALGDLGFE